VTIRQKLRLSILLLIVACVTITGTVAYTFHAVHRATAHLTAVNHVGRLVFELSLLGYEYQAYHEKRVIGQWWAIYRQLDQRLATVVADSALSEEHAVLRRMRDSHALLGTLFETLTAQATPPEAVRLVSQSLLLRSNMLVADAHQLADVYNQAISTRTVTLLSILIGSLAPLAVACVFISIAHRRILRSLATLHTGAAVLGRGQLTHTLQVSGQDEFATLARTLNTMAAQLHADIAQREHAQAQLQQYTQELARSNADLEQFAYTASHDLQEPLRAISGCLQLLKQRYTGQLDAYATELMQHAVDGAMRLQTLIQDLLAYTRLSTGSTSFAPVICAVVLDQTLAHLHTAIEKSGAIISHDPLPTVQADATQLLQLFRHLLGNALKFRSEEPLTIHIGAEHQEGAWMFSVRDNGIGLAARHAERIFFIFQRLHTRRHYPGTGMGLALCKKIVERHGGRIWVQSEVGKGATFYFTIPDRGEIS
jgi:signal transduction histidine kinase